MAASFRLAPTLFAIGFGSCIYGGSAMATPPAVGSMLPLPRTAREAVLIPVPAGRTQIGDDNAPPDERPSFTREVTAFLLDRTPVTVAQFRTFVSETGYVTDAERFGSAGVLDQKEGGWIAEPGATWRRPYGAAGARATASHPVTQVSWYDADTFCHAYGARLPTELEWEYAARQGQTPDGHVFRAGEPLQRGDHFDANVWQGFFPLLDSGEDGYRGTSPVGAFGAAPSGLTDMAGNVWQWTASWYVPYGSPVTEPRDINAERVRRGGSFLCDPTFCEGFRATARGHSTPDTSLINVGFRCAVDANSPAPLAGRRAEIRPVVATPAARPPNIILILADDLGYADISAYGIGRFSTPNIDRIGLQGVRFTDGYASAPVCGPSRAGLQTGRYQNRFGFEYNNGPAKRDLSEGFGLDLGEITLAQLLKAQGYHTALVGKWHLGMQDPFYPTQRGYDEFVGFLPGQTSYIDPRQPGVHLSRSPGAADGDGEDLAGGSDSLGPFTRHPLTQILEGPDRRIVHNEDQYLTDYLAARDVQFIEQRAKTGEPYFLYAAFNAVHAPLMVSQKYYDRFPQIKDDQLRIYAAMVAALDDAVGRILDAVEQSGQARSTLVVFASDNGCAAYLPGLCSCEPLRGGKLSHYEGGTRVPFMMRWPGRIPSGLVYREVVSLLDVLPTAVAVAGGRLPGDRIYDGIDIMPYLTGHRAGTPHDMLVWRRRPLVSIRKGDWKLWESVNDTTGQFGEYKLLFNLRTDLNESTNLSARYPAKVKELEALIREWAQEMTGPRWPSRPPGQYEVCGTPFRLPI